MSISYSMPLPPKTRSLSDLKSQGYKLLLQNKKITNVEHRSWVYWPHFQLSQGHSF